MGTRKKTHAFLLIRSLYFILASISTFALANETVTETRFPLGELFEPIVADPKEPQFSTGFHHVDSSGRLGEFTAGVVSYGEHFGLKRWRERDDQQWQVSIVGALFAQFNMDADSKDLINADYTIGVSTTHRRGPYSYRLRFFHQSSHLGDELLLGESAPPERINLSLEAIDFLASHQWQEFRLYGGFGYLIDVEPSTLDRAFLQLGGEYHAVKQQLFNGRLVGGINLSSIEGDDWGINTAVKYGLEYGEAGSGNRRIRVMLEYYRGDVPFGQFYDVGITSFGLSAYLLF